MRDYGLPLPWGIVPTERLLRVITGDDPAAGAEWSVTVPGGVIWQLYSARVTFVTSAVAGAREPSLTFDDGALSFFLSTDASSQAASTTRNWSWAMGLGATTGMVRNFVAALPTPALPLQAGYRIRSETFNLDVGDNYGAPVLYVAEYQVRGLERAVERYEREVAQAVAAPG